MLFCKTYQVYNREQDEATRREQSFRSCVYNREQDEATRREQSFKSCVYNRKQGEATRREQSFRNCVVILIVFIFLSLILILANIPWKKQNEKKHKEQYSERTPQGNATGRKEDAQIIITKITEQISKEDIESTTQSNIIDVNNETEKYTANATSDTTETTTLIFCNHSTTMIAPTNYDISTGRKEDAQTIITMIIEQISKEDVESTTQSNITDINDETEKYTANAISSITETTTSISSNHSTTMIAPTSYDISTGRKEDAQTIITMITEQTSKEDVESTTHSNITDINDETDKYTANAISSITETTTSISSNHSTTMIAPTSYDNSTGRKDAQIIITMITEQTSKEDVESTTQDDITDINDETEKYIANATSDTTETTSLISSNHSTTMIVPTSYGTNFPFTIIIPNENANNICNTSYCEQIANKISSYMNVSTNPCNDFYKYACGGFETNLQLKDIYLVQRNKTYERIKKQIMKEKRENVSSTFATYYDSCLKYEKNVSLSKRKEMASKQLKKVGQFYINNTVCEKTANFTKLFAQLILHHSALVFDVVPEIDEDGSHNFTLKISPTTYENFFEAEFINSYFGNDLETNSYYEDPESLCSNNERKKNDRKDEIKRSISKTLKELHVFKNLNDNYLELKCINETINIIDSAIMQRYFWNFMSEDNNKEVYLIEHYKRISLKELEKENSSTFVNWTQLIGLLLETNNITNKNIQVYFHNKLFEDLRSMVNFTDTNCMDFNNAIMALYAHKLYQELVLPRQNASNHCLQVTIYLLRPEATNLYISSFTDHEIERMNNRTTNMFNELKQTLKWKIENATRPDGERKHILLNKTESLKLALPPVSYLKNRDLLHDNNTFQNTLSENYFDNSISLMKRYRTLMYTEIRREFNISEQIWTYYATPFQLQAKMIYCLSQIAIPYGMIELHSASNEDSFNYVERTTLGNLIAHQIVHHFDKLDYWNLTENTHLFEIFKNSSIDINTIEKTEPLPATNQTECSKLILNKKSSEIIKFGLVKETLNRTTPPMEFNIDKLFYVAYVQAYCSKSQFTSFYIASYENENLWNRDRITVVISNDQFFAKTWNCSNSQNISNPE